MNFTINKFKPVILKAILGIVMLSLILVSAGCKEEESAKLSIGLMSDVGAIPFFIAQENGYFEALGIEVDLEVFKSAIDRDAALQTGNLQGAMADMLAVFFFNEAGIDMKMTSDTYGNYRMVTSPDESLDAFMSNENKSIGLSSNTVIDFATQLIAEKEGFADQLESIAIPQMPVRLEMLKSNELNGATLPEPLASLALLEGGDLVADTELLDLYPGVFIFNEATLSENPDEVKKFYEAYNQAVDYINSEDIASYYDSLVDHLSFPPTLKDTFNMPHFDYAKVADVYTYNEVMNWMINLELIKNSYEFEDLSDHSFLPSK